MKIKMDIIGYEDLYTIDEQGNVFSKKSKKKMKHIMTAFGYFKINLSSNGVKKLVSVHRLIAIHFIPNPEKKPLIDHKNGIKIDNRIENLRWVTVSENGMNSKLPCTNTTGYRGVSFYKSDNKYVACIYLNNQRIYIGSYNTALEASEAYETKAKELFGEYKREIN